MPKEYGSDYCHTCGFLLSEKGRFVRIALSVGHLNDDDMSATETIDIPKVAIKKMKVLK